MYWTWELKTAVIFLMLQTCKTAKPENTGPAVFEVINEHAKIDDKKVLPYENPLAGNSRKNAKLHAQHQQAMFNAERVRQHRAQLLRWNNQHPKQQVDSYMKAYQESQESHHLTLEKTQSNSKEKKARGRSDQTRTLKDNAQLEPSKITRSDAVNKNRNHRSFGSIHTSHHNKYKIHTYPGPTYDQGVTIKPNGNLGLYNYAKEHRTLYTEAIPSKSHYIYPKLYSQAYAYQTANDISSLSSLLSQPPQEQLTQLNNLINSPKEIESDTLNTNNDLYYYLKDSQLSNEESSLSSVGFNSAGHVIHKDFTPITEEIDDIEDNRDPRIKFIQPAPTALSQEGDGAVTTESSYYKIEGEQSVKNDASKSTQYVSQDVPNYEALKHETPLHFYLNEPSTKGVKYLKSQPTGVQHLTQDGTGVSAYGDGDVSIKNHRTKRDLDTEYFILGNYTSTTENIQPVSNETLNNLEMNCTLNIYNFTLSDHKNETLPTPEELKRSRYLLTDSAYNIGEAYDYDYSYDENEPNGNNKFDYSDENDYDYESTIPEYDYEVPRQRPRPNRPRRPDTNQNRNKGGSFSNRFSKFRHPNFDDYHPESLNREYGDHFDSLHYGTGNQFGLPTSSYGSPVIQTPTSFPSIQHGLNPVSQGSEVINSLQPVYMLTQSQIKHLLSNQKLNIEHLDVFQWPHDFVQKPRRLKYPRQHKPRYSRFPKSGRKYKLGRLRKLNKFVKF